MTDQNATRNAPNLFEDPSIAQSAKDDPVARFLAVHWKRLLGTLVVALLAVYAYNTFKATNEAKRAAASDLFRDVQVNYSMYSGQESSLAQLRIDLAKATDEKQKTELNEKITKTTTEAAEQRAKLERMLQALEDELVEPFPKLAQIYRALLFVKGNEDISRVRSILGTTNWEGAGSPESADRFAAELGALVLGRALIDRDDSMQEGISILSGLAERGSVAQVPAAITLAAVVSTPEDKKKTLGILDTIVEKNPAQAKFLTQAREQLQ